MSCGPCCSPTPPVPKDFRHAPNPDAVQTAKPRPPRRRTFFNRTLHDVSLKAQYPSLLTFRDIITVLWVVYAVYHLSFAVRQTCWLLFSQPVGQACPSYGYGAGYSLVGCMWYAYRYQLVGAVYAWLAAVIPWAIVAVVTVFFGEEVIRRVRT